MMILPLLTALVALHLIQADHFLIETEDKNVEFLADANTTSRGGNDYALKSCRGASTSQFN